MNRKKIKNILLLLLGLIWANVAPAQCVISELKGQGYFGASCGNMFFQSTIGVLSGDIYTTCGGFVFSSPLSSGDIISSDSRIPPLEILIIPNPTVYQIQILGIEHTQAQIEILNAAGQIIYLQESLIDHVITVDTWPEGLYMVYIRDKNSGRVGHQKFIKIN
jgi:hypothetical protein